MSTFVFVHGAWHTGAQLEATAAPLRVAGHTVHLPTLAGNRPGDSRTVGLSAAIDSLVQILEADDLQDIVLVGHSYAGMVITGVADRVPARIRRLVYWNAFVPHHGESLNDLVPPHYVQMFQSLVAPDGGMMIPFPVWREAFMNDASLEQAQAAHAQLNRHPWKTFTDAIQLTRSPADFTCGKSYINATEDTSMPHAFPWHPRLSQKLGLFRLVQTPGSHELCFTNPTRLAQAILEAGRD